MISARGSDHAGSGNLALQQVGECAARLERAGMLQQFEFQYERCICSEIGTIYFDDRSAADVRRNDPVGGADFSGGDQ